MKLGKYRHYKGSLYQVIGIACHSETLEELVIYQRVNEHGIASKISLWARPKKMFFESVIVDGKKVLRFEPIKK